MENFEGFNNLGHVDDTDEELNNLNEEGLNTAADEDEDGDSVVEDSYDDDEKYSY